MKEERTFDMGEIDGTYKYWYANGHLHMEQSYERVNHMVVDMVV